MTISSRTPEGRPNRCPVCRQRLRLTPSWPSADAPCPHCGSLVWFRFNRRSPAKATVADRAADFTLDDFRKRFEQMWETGGIRQLIGRLPGASEPFPEGEDPETAAKRIRGMIDAMTEEERAQPNILDAARRQRVALGAGVQANEVEQFLEQFAQVRALMNQVARMSARQRGV